MGEGGGAGRPERRWQGAGSFLSTWLSCLANAQTVPCAGLKNVADLDVDGHPHLRKGN